MSITEYINTLNFYLKPRNLDPWVMIRIFRYQFAKDNFFRLKYLTGPQENIIAQKIQSFICNF